MLRNISVDIMYLPAKVLPKVMELSKLLNKYMKQLNKEKQNWSKLGDAPGLPADISEKYWNDKNNNVGHHKKISQITWLSGDFTLAVPLLYHWHIWNLKPCIWEKQKISIIRY